MGDQYSDLDFRFAFSAFQKSAGIIPQTREKTSSKASRKPELAAIFPQAIAALVISDYLKFEI